MDLLMTRTLHHAVIHHVIKEKNTTTASKKIAPTELPPDDKGVVSTFETVLSLYGKQGNTVRRGVFKDQPSGGCYPMAVNSYLSHSVESKDVFLPMTKDVTERIRDKSANVNFATGGFLFFFDYSDSQGRYLLIAMVKHTDGQQVNDQLGVKELKYLDFKKLNQASRVNMKLYRQYLDANTEKRVHMQFLSVISRSESRKAADYFVDALGLHIGSTSKATTKKVRAESVKFFKGDERLAPYAKEYRANLNRYLGAVAERNTAETPEDEIVKATLERIGKVARVLMDRAYPEEEYGDKATQLEKEFIEHLNSDEIGIDDEFQVDATEVKNDRQIKYSDKDFALTVNKDELGDDDKANYQYNKAVDGKTSSLLLRNIPDKLDTLIREFLEIDSEATE